MVCLGIANYLELSKLLENVIFLIQFLMYGFQNKNKINVDVKKGNWNNDRETLEQWQKI